MSAPTAMRIRSLGDTWQVPRRPRDQQRTPPPCVIIPGVIERPAGSEPYGVMEATELRGWVLVDAERYRIVDPPYLYPTREAALAGLERRIAEDREEAEARARFEEELRRLRDEPA